MMQKENNKSVHSIESLLARKETKKIRITGPQSEYRMCHYEWQCNCS